MEAGNLGAMSRSQRELVWEVVDGEAVIVDVTTGDYFSLNRIATAVWTSLQGGVPLAAIVDATAARYAVDRSTVEHDVGDLVDELEDIGLWSR